MTRALSEVQSELSRMGLSCSKDMVEELAKVLTPDERLLAGTTGDSKSYGNNTYTLLLATTLQVVDVTRQKDWLGGSSSGIRAMYWRDVADVIYQPGSDGLFGQSYEVHIRHYANIAGLWVIFKKNMNRTSLDHVIGVVKDQVARAKSGPATSGPTGSDVAEQLERLAALHRSDALSNAEFEAAKRKLLE